MKNFALSLILASSLLSLPALAASKVFNHYTNINFDKGNVSVNMMDDGINLPDEFDELGFGIRFKLRAGETFTVATKANDNGTGVMPTCKYSKAVEKSLRGKKRQVTIQVDPNVETDDGSNCDYTITLNNGKSVTVNFESTGT